MDTGLNNRNTLHLAIDDEYLEDVEWIIEATSKERFQIWKDYHEKMNWEEVNFGLSYEILIMMVKPKGSEKEEALPVMLELSFAIVNGHKIAFYTSNSRLVHWGYIEAFLITYFQRTHDGYTRWNHTNASNVHNCFGSLDDIDKKPRDAKYKPQSDEKKYHIFEPVDQEK
jgi:hypothetical protein